MGSGISASLLLPTWDASSQPQHTHTSPAAAAARCALTPCVRPQARALAQVGGDLSRIKLPTTAQLDDMVQRAKNASEGRQDGQEYNMAKLHFNAQAREIERRDGSENIYC